MSKRKNFLILSGTVVLLVSLSLLMIPFVPRAVAEVRVGLPKRVVK